MFFPHSLESLTKTSDEACDESDIELIQHINVNLERLIKLLNGRSYKASSDGVSVLGGGGVRGRLGSACHQFLFKVTN